MLVVLQKKQDQHQTDSPLEFGVFLFNQMDLNFV